MCLRKTVKVRGVVTRVFEHPRSGDNWVQIQDLARKNKSQEIEYDHVCRCVYMNMCICVYICIYTHIHTYIYTYIYIYIYIHTHTHRTSNIHHAYISSEHGTTSNRAQSLNLELNLHI